MSPSRRLPVRQYGSIPSVGLNDDLLSLRLPPYQRFLERGIADSLRNMPAIASDAGRYSIHLSEPTLGKPERSPQQYVAEGLTYDAPIKVWASLADSHTGEIVRQQRWLCSIPLMDDGGRFIISGVRRVIIHQIVRSPGAWFSVEQEPVSGKLLGSCRLSPERGSWLNFETNKHDLLRVKLNSGRRLSALVILRLFGLETNKQLMKAFEHVDTDRERSFIWNALKHGDCRNHTDALRRLYAEVARGYPFNEGKAVERVHKTFFNPQYYSLSQAGRHMLNRRFGVCDKGMLLTLDDLVRVVSRVIQLSLGKVEPDDIDHLSNRRVRTAAELVQNEFEAGLYDLTRAVSERLTTADLNGVDSITPRDVLRTDALQKRLDAFFSTSKLSQVADETNPISELTHKRRVTSLGPGGLNRQNAGVDPRDVHPSYYGRICPIETPEGQNIGLLSTLSIAADVDDIGLLTTPVRAVKKQMSSHSADIIGRTITEDVHIENEVVCTSGAVVEASLHKRLTNMPKRMLPVRPYVSFASEDVAHFNAFEEAQYTIGQCTLVLDSLGQIQQEVVEAREGDDWVLAPADKLDYLDLNPKQIVSASTALIPFLEHDDANRALMGCNMQRQAVPLVKPQPALVATGMEWDVARNCSYQVKAPSDGIMTEVTADYITFKPDDGGGEQTFPLQNAVRSNNFTWIKQTPIVEKHQRVWAGQPLVDGPAASEEELALGQRVLVAYMCWDGYNFEDAVIISEKVVREGKFQSRVLKRYRLDAADTALGTEIITREVPNVAKWRKQKLDENGIVPIGANVKPGQILVGMAAPKPVLAEEEQTDRSPEWKMLIKAFGETHDNIRFQDRSLLLPKGQEGVVVDVKVIRRNDDSDAARALPKGCHTRVEVEVAGKRNLQPGDKMSGRHGNKGCVSIVVPEPDMPHLSDGTPIDVVLSPLGVPSRMNLGQLMEVHLGWAAHRLGFRARTGVFDSASWQQVEQCLAQAWLVEHAGGLRRSSLPEDDVCQVDWKRVKRWAYERYYDYEKLFGKNAEDGEYPGEICLREWMQTLNIDHNRFANYEQLHAAALHLNRDYNTSAPITGKQMLYDGRTGEAFDRPVTVGYKYMLKLSHMVADKAHARSTGTYSVTTQQPLGGKSSGGGQRLGEMEVWALEGYSAAHILREMLTVKSDDIEGREAMTRAIMSHKEGTRMSATRIQPGLPFSFEVMLNELRALGLDPTLLYDGVPQSASPIPTNVEVHHETVVAN